MQQVMYANGKLWGALDTAINPDGGAQRAGIAWYIVKPSSTAQARPAGLPRGDRRRLHLPGDRGHGQRPWRDGLHRHRRHAQPERRLTRRSTRWPASAPGTSSTAARAPPRTTASPATRRRSATRRAPAGATTAPPRWTATRLDRQRVHRPRLRLHDLGRSVLRAARRQPARHLRRGQPWRRAHGPRSATGPPGSASSPRSLETDAGDPPATANRRTETLVAFRHEGLVMSISAGGARPGSRTG